MSLFHLSLSANFLQPFFVGGKFRGVGLPFYATTLSLSNIFSQGFSFPLFLFCSTFTSFNNISHQLIRIFFDDRKILVDLGNLGWKVTQFFLLFVFWKGVRSSWTEFKVIKRGDCFKQKKLTMGILLLVCLVFFALLSSPLLHLLQRRDEKIYI